MIANRKSPLGRGTFVPPLSRPVGEFQAVEPDFGGCSVPRPQDADFVVQPVSGSRFLPAAGRTATPTKGPRQVTFSTPRRFAWTTTGKLGKEHGWWDRLGEPSDRSTETKLGGGVSRLGSAETGLRWLYYRPEELARHAELLLASTPDQDASAETKAAMARTRAAFLRRAQWMAAHSEAQGGYGGGDQGAMPRLGPGTDGSDVAGIRLNALRRIRCLLANLRAAELEAEGLSQQQLSEILHRAKQRSEADAIQLAAQRRQAAVKRVLSKSRAVPPAVPRGGVAPPVPPHHGVGSRAGTSCRAATSPVKLQVMDSSPAGFLGADHLHRAHAEVQSQAAMIRHGQLRGVGAWGDYRGLTHLAQEDPLFAAGTLEHFKREFRVRAVGGERSREGQVKRTVQRALLGKHSLAGDAVQGDLESDARASAAAHSVLGAVGGVGGYPHHSLATTDLRAAPRCRVL